MLRSPEERAARELLRQAAKAKRAAEPARVEKAPQIAAEAFSAPARPHVPAKVKTALLTKHNGCCAYPGCGATENLQFDHVIVRELGGPDGPENMEPLCPPCHRRKTALDVKMIAKAKRIENKRLGKTKPKGTIKSAGFDCGYRPFGRS